MLDEGQRLEEVGIYAKLGCKAKINQMSIQ